MGHAIGTDSTLRRRALSALAIALTLVACSTARPVLYPNAHLQSVGREVADRDIAECDSMAKAAGATRHSGAREVATGTAVGGGIGAASGAVGGAIAGGGAGIGAAIGAATGAVVGFLGTLFSRRSSPSPAYTSFVDRCLREKGYEPTGWQ